MAFRKTYGTSKTRKPRKTLAQKIAFQQGKLAGLKAVAAKKRRSRKRRY